MQMLKPALMLPMGKADYEAGSRMAFLRSVRPILERLGWCIGVEAKGLSLKCWAKDCFEEIRLLGGRITYHPPDIFSGRGDPQKSFSEILEEIAAQVSWYRRLGLELATIHLKPIVTEDPSADAGLERYNSPISAEEMIDHIRLHISFLRKLNVDMGGILSIENVSLTNFCQAGYRVPTHLTLRAGCWWDLIWLKEHAGVNITFDCEHFLSAGNLLARRRDLYGLERLIPIEWTESEKELSGISGYRLVEGFPPKNTQRAINMPNFINISQPALYHLGGAVRDVDDQGRIESHLPIDILHSNQKRVLDLNLRSIMATDAIGVVVEVCGNLLPDKYSPWSPRPCNDEVAKMQTYLAVIDEIVKLQQGIRTN